MEDDEMKTSKEFQNNLKNKIITKEMLNQALYSVNKRAKNYRDKEREYLKIARNPYGGGSMYDYAERAEEKKEEFYKLKDKLLTVLKPTCIHLEIQHRKKKYYDYDEKYDLLAEEDVAYYSYYYDKRKERYVDFAVVYEPVECYYLFYDFGTHSYHTPITSPDDYQNLEIIEIESLVTHGANYYDLMSTQFVRKMIEVIDGGAYCYQG